MKKNRKRLLMIPSDNAGIGHFRNIWPAQQIRKDFSDEFEVEINNQPNLSNLDYIKSFDIVHFHRHLGPHEGMPERFKEIRDSGTILIMDLDDYWNPPKTHPLYTAAMSEKLPEKITSTLKNVDYVSTTTNIFANYIKKHNPNVLVMVNAIDPEHRMWKEDHEKTNDKVRISWIGGSSHLNDLEAIRESMNILHHDNNLKGKYQMIMCGYDVRGQITEISPDGKQRRTRKIAPHETVWNRFEEIFTSNYACTDEKYLKWLKKCKNESYPFEDLYEETFIRRWTLPLTQYGRHYNYCDVCLAPLAENTFNEVKCIVGDSLISTDKGFMSIEDIVNNKKTIKTEIDGDLNKTINYFKYKHKETIKITTKDGYNIEGTPHHKILIENKWVALEKLKIGDKIELTKPIIKQKKYQELTYPMLLTKNTENKISNSNEYMLPRIRINENWGRLLGYLLGDGHLNARSKVSISCDKRYEDIVDDVVNLFTSIGLNPKIYPKIPDKRCNNSLIKEGFGVDITLTSKTFINIAKKYGWMGKNGKTFRIPKVILESPKSVIVEFLKGLFEADGTVGNKSPVSLTSKDLKLIQQVQVLLLSFNIQSKISHSYNKHYRKYYYKLTLRRLDSEIFLKEIGFVSKQKQNKLNEFATGKHSNNEFKPNLKDTIVSIEKNKNDVFDIEIDNVHSYNANGIINHNSELKIIEAGMKRKVLIAQDFAIYKDLIKHGENGLLVPTIKNTKGWYKNIKKVVEDKDFREGLADNLYNFIKNKYNLKTATEERVKIYNSLLEKREKL